MKHQKTLTSWGPSASISTLQARAELCRQIRDFFWQRSVLEVETPIIGQFATVDPYIDSLVTHQGNTKLFLQTSPEFFLKRLVAAGSGDVFSLGKVFRHGERGHRHHPEFTLLEWYRVGWDEHRLMQEVVELLQLFFPGMQSIKLSYRELFLNTLDIDPHVTTLNSLQQLITQQVEMDIDDSIDKDTCLDILMTHCIEPTLPDGLVIIHDFPASKAALAQLDSNNRGQVVARRFEVYWQGMELANGYYELTDADEQRQRFEADLARRRQCGLTQYPYDEQLVQALISGLPECAGVALGLDRLLMAYLGKKNISEVISFTE